MEQLEGLAILDIKKVRVQGAHLKNLNASLLRLIHYTHTHFKLTMSLRYINEQNDPCLHGVYIPLGEMQ